MVRFAGYARKREPKWPYAMIFLAIILVAVLIITVVSAVGQWLEYQINKPVTTTTTTLLVSAESTTSTSLGGTTSSAVTTSTIQVSEPVPASAGIKVEKIVIASGIDEYSRPIDDLLEVAVETNPTIYCCTRISSEIVPQAIKHVWVAPGGRVVAEIDLTVRNRTADTYSYISLDGIRTGKWEVRVETKDGAILASRSFTTY
jgi:hypothetical protein